MYSIAVVIMSHCNHGLDVKRDRIGSNEWLLRCVLVKSLLSLALVAVPYPHSEG